MIKFDHVTKRYPGSDDILKNVSLTIEAGEFVFVTGHSGAGKSTLLKLIAALERPTHGTVLIANQNISQLKDSALPFMRRRFGLIFQDHKLLYDRNCFENVILPLHINGITGLMPLNVCAPHWIKSGCSKKKKPCPLRCQAVSSSA